MKVVNPLGRTPTTHEVAAMDCHCVCNVQMDDHGWNWAGGWVPVGGTCGCGCNGSSANNLSNSQSAVEA